MDTKNERQELIEGISKLLNHTCKKRAEHHPEDHAGHLYALLSMGNYQELREHLAHFNIENEFWKLVGHLPPQINEHFIASELGEWDELPDNPIKEWGLLPGDIIVIKQQQHTLWEWQHAGMIKDENTLYSAMYTKTVMEQEFDYYRIYAVQLRALKVKANHEQPELGEQACNIAHSRLGNLYGISDKGYAIRHDDAPMYCSQVPWFAWIMSCGLNLDSGSPDYDEIEDLDERLAHLCSIKHDIVYPTNLAESHSNRSEHGYVAKTECVADVVRKESGQ